MANRNQNDYNDQDYPRYHDRNDRYDSQSERGGFDRNRRSEERNRSGSGRENTQGGASDYNRSSEQSGFGGTGVRGSDFGNDYGRGDDANNRNNDDFASTTRSGGGGYGSETRRGMRDDRSDYTLYGYERDGRAPDRSGDYGGRGQRTTRDYSSNYGYSGGSYARSDDDQQSNYGRGGSSRYRAEQGSGGSDYRQQNSGQSFYGQGSGGYSGTSEQGFDYNRSDNRTSNRPRSEQEERGWWERTTDEVASWFGDDEATRRREHDSRENDYSRYQTGGGQYGQQASSHRGRGPKNYRRSDDRIKDDINDRLTDYPYLDASDIDVEVSSGEVTLIGTVESRYAKRMAEDIAENVSGVSHLENRLRVKNQSQPGEYSNQNQAGFSTANASDSSGTYGSREDLAANYSNLGLTEVSPIGKPATGDLTGSNTAAMSASATTENSTALDDQNEAESTDRLDEFDSSATFSQRGVDKLSDSSK